MTSIRLEEKSIDLNGRTYVLHVNMSVLDRIQGACGGSINGMLQKNMYDGNAITMAAMLNDWSEDQGWEEEWTAKKVKKLFSASMMNMLDVTGMFFRALTPENETEAPKSENGNQDIESGN